MPTAGEFLNALALKAGLKPDDELLKNVLSAPGLTQIVIPDELVTRMDAGLLNIEVAKNNHPDIKKKYFADAYDGIDAEIMKVVDTDTELLDIIKQEKSTAKKINLLAQKLKAAKPSDATEVTPLKQKINELQQQLAQLAEQKTQLETKHQEDIRNMKRDVVLESAFAEYKTKFDDDPVIRKMMLRNLIDKNLQDSNAVLGIDDNGNLTIVGKDGTNVVGSDHRPLTPKAFLDKTFASILQVSAPQKPNAPVSTPNKPFAQVPGNDHIGLHNAQALSDFENAGRAKMF